MLLELRIKNLAIIGEMEVSFAAGLNVITGETGAGKSIIIGALSLLLGERASAELIRSGEETLTVEGVFDVSALPEMCRRLEEMGIEATDTLVIRRTVSRTGKNRVYVGGATVTIGELTAISENLVAICSQHEHQVLLRASNHVDLLDNFCLPPEMRDAYTALFERVMAQTRQRDALVQSNEQRRLREDFLRYQLTELATANLLPGEDEALEEERLVLVNAQRLHEHAQNALALLYLDSGAVMEKLRRVLADVQAIAKIDSRLQVAPKELEGLCYQLEDTAAALREYVGRVVFSPERLAEVEERLEAIKRLKRKHGGELAAVIAKHAEIAAEIDQLTTLEEEIAALSQQIEALETDLLVQAQAISQKRREGAKGLKEAMEAEIAALRLAGAVFETVFTTVPLNSRGGDGVEFYLSTNVGEKPKPLSHIASGGELSRIVLAMRSALAQADVVATIIFDEVDSGIGGAVASLVGEKIAKISQERQVICITHLPQIACFAQKHFAANKAVVGGQTLTNLQELEGEGSEEEIARMLGGKEMTAITREHAREMLKAAKGSQSQQTKNTWEVM